jgi:hypothetical protein
MELLELRTQRIDFTQLIGNGYDLDNVGLDGGKAGVMKLIIQNNTDEDLQANSIFASKDGGSTLDLAATGTGSAIQFRLRFSFTVPPTSGFVTIIYLTPGNRSNC